MSLRDLIPFGLASEKPWHYRRHGSRRLDQSRQSALRLARTQSRGLRRLFARALCLKDNVISGTHLCMTRLNLLP